MATLYPGMRNLKDCHSSNYSVVDLAFRTARILPCSPMPAQVLLLILTRLCSRQRPVLLSAFLHSWYLQSIKLGLASGAVMAQTTMDDTSPAITYLPTQEDWVFENMKGWFNNTLQYVLYHDPSVPCADVLLYCQFHPEKWSTGTVHIQW
jgi:hypothetical protein